jgi:hypothetical protein
VSFSLGAAFAVTGSAGTTSLGNETVSVAIVVLPTGVSGTASAGTGTSAPIQSLGLSVTGVSATGSVGEEKLYRPIVPSQTPNWSSIAA